jgi:hypothetical protein
MRTNTTASFMGTSHLVETLEEVPKVRCKRSRTMNRGQDEEVTVGRCRASRNRHITNRRCRSIMYPDPITIEQFHPQNPPMQRILQMQHPSE